MSSTGEEVFFKIKRSTKLTKLQGAYASKVGKDVGSIRSVFFLFFLHIHVLVYEYPCTHDGSNFDISILIIFTFPLFSLDFCTMELGYKMMTLQHHLIWRTTVCSKDPCFMFSTIDLLRCLDTIDVMVERKSFNYPPIFDKKNAQKTLFYIRGWRVCTLGSLSWRF